MLVQVVLMPAACRNNGKLRQPAVAEAMLDGMCTGLAWGTCLNMTTPLMHMLFTLLMVVIPQVQYTGCLGHATSEAQHSFRKLLV